MTVRTRFAPSPTGFIHLGNIRSALYPWAFARATGGTFILRIEDTDLERSSQAAVDVIIEGMKWLGLDHDEGPFYQMQRMDRYKAVLAEMVEKGLVYPCYMSVAELDALRERQMANKEKPRYDGTWRPEPGKVLPPVPEGVKPVLRFKNPQGGSVVWEDKVKGRVEFSNDELDDLVIARPDGTPTYNFCVVVDDIDMAITHVIRGEEWLPSAPLHVLIYEAFGWERPAFAHLPLILKPDGNGKLSKRDGDRLGFPVFPLNWTDPTSGEQSSGYRERGYYPEAFVNMLALLGWNPGTDQELMDKDTLVKLFDLNRVHKGGAKFDPEKTKWFNQQYLRHRPDHELGVRHARRQKPCEKHAREPFVTHWLVPPLTDSAGVGQAPLDDWTVQDVRLSKTSGGA